MNHQSYYRLADGSGCNLAVADRALVVNCAGVCAMTEPFVSHNREGRRDYYLMVLAQGELMMDISGTERIVCAGQAVIHPPGRGYRYAKASRDRLVYYWAHFTGSGAADMLKSCGLETGRVYTPGVCGEVADGFTALFGNFIHRDLCFEAATGAQLTAICVLLRRRIDGAAAAGSGRSPERIRESLHFLHRKYGGPVAVPELAAIEHLSVSRYCAVFKQCMGVSPQAFLIDLRLNMAVELMLRTDLGIKQIARSVGYDDPLYFSRLFRRRRGLSPRQYMAASGRSAR